MDGFLTLNDGLGVQTLLLACGVVAAKDAGIPVPVPSDLLIISVGAAAALGGVPLPIVLMFLLIASVVGSFGHLALCRGPLRWTVERFGRRVGLTPARLDNASRQLARAGWPGIAVSRVLPGVRAITVTACGMGALPMRVVVPGVVAGSLLFLALHLAIGFVFGPAVFTTLSRLNAPAGGLIALLAVIGLAAWLVMKRKQRPVEGLAAWSEACCPACLILGNVDPLDLTGRRGPQPA